ncbi:hypothetical protein Acy02nite_80590 [Actinoplanes cyaneus]|uniref:Uncharacterized protein n=2 Tax=Actinoplanes cyaneus TaxID=52696 RepID=A0A919MA56_9ACTN|nr:hypothetical protein [Actinoplanes cyaneus]GID70178.1 hypothetical protein Acy02nite_80590 [Actinoplanes cyaneus]
MPTLEERMNEQEKLRASQDRDLADIGEKLKAQDGLLKGLAKTQSEHTATLAVHTATLERHTAILDRHTTTLDRHTAMLKNQETEIAWIRLDMSGLKDSVQAMTGMLHTLIERGDQQ